MFVFIFSKYLKPPTTLGQKLRPNQTLICPTWWCLNLKSAWVIKLPCCKLIRCGKSMNIHSFHGKSSANAGSSWVSIISKKLLQGIWNLVSSCRSAPHHPRHSPEDRGSCLQWPLWTPMRTSGRAAGQAPKKKVPRSCVLGPPLVSKIGKSHMTQH